MAIRPISWTMKVVPLPRAVSGLIKVDKRSINLITALNYSKTNNTHAEYIKTEYVCQVSNIN